MGFAHCFSLFSLARLIVGAILFLKSSNLCQSLLLSLGRGGMTLPGVVCVTFLKHSTDITRLTC